MTRRTDEQAGRRTLSTLVMTALLFIPAFLVDASPERGAAWVTEAVAGAEATVVVNAIRATAEGDGPDEQSSRFRKVLAKTPYKGFKHQGQAKLETELGKSADAKLGGRSVGARLKALGEKATVEVTLEKADGGSHRVTLSLKNGASTVIALDQGDSGATLYIVTLKY